MNGQGNATATAILPKVTRKQQPGEFQLEFGAAELKMTSFAVFSQHLFDC